MAGNRRGFLKKLRKESEKWKLFWSSFKWNRVTLPESFVENVVFQIMSVIEAIVMVFALCFFYLRFGFTF